MLNSTSTLVKSDKGPKKLIMDTQRTAPTWLKPATEYGPILVFFAAYYLADLFIATAAIMAATAIAIALSYAIERRIPMMPLMTAVIVVPAPN